jgi:hypothetical protein
MVAMAELVRRRCVPAILDAPAMTNPESGLLSTGRILDGFARGTLRRPSWETPNLIDLSRALGERCGAPTDRSSPAARKLAQQIGEAKNYLLVLMDGLGIDMVRAMPDGFIPSHLQGELRTVFPATTAAALTSLSTGVWPAEHGVPTWYVYLEEIDATVRPLPYDERSTGKPLGDLGLDPSQLFPVQSLLWQCASRPVGLMPTHIAKSVYSSYLMGPGVVIGYECLEDALAVLEVEAQKPADVPGFFYLYVADVDALSHEKGKWHPDVVRRLREIDGLLGRFRERTLGAVRMVLSADHGFRDAPPERRFALHEQADLLALLAHPPSGDSRVAVFHVLEERIDLFCERFHERFGQHFALVSPSQVEDLGLLGPMPLSTLTRRRLGNVLAVSLDDSILEHVDKCNPQIAAHSGLSPEEMEIPLVLA